MAIISYLLISLFIHLNQGEFTKLLVTAGSSEESSNNGFTEVIDIKTGKYQICQTFPVKQLAGSQMTMINDLPTVCGGRDNGKKCYSLKSDKWELLESISLKHLRFFSSSNYVPNLGFWIGGGSWSPENSEYFDGKGWVDGPQMPLEIKAHCSVQISESKTMIMGGDIWVDGIEEYSTKRTWIYDWNTQSWTEAAKMKFGRNDLMCGFDSKIGKVIVIGGDNNGKVLSTTEIYDPLSDSWSDGKNLPVRIIEGAMVNMNGNDNNGTLVLVGGEKFPTYYNTIYEWKSETLSWELLEVKLKYPKFDLVALAVPDTVFDGCVGHKEE